MSYQYDQSDFKRYLNDRNPKNRVDGLMFWQNRIPLPIDLFNRIFDESDQIVTDYVYQVVSSAVAFNNRDSFEKELGIKVSDLPNGNLKQHVFLLQQWLERYLAEDSAERHMAYEIADILNLDNFSFSMDKVVRSMQHQGKKYARLFMPSEVRQELKKISGSDGVGIDNTDMFGNIIADRYNIYRSGFSDALAIIFNAMLEFRILCSGRGKHLHRFSILNTALNDMDIRLGRTTDGSLWEPGYEDDHYITLNKEHPLTRKLTEDQARPLSEVLFFLGEYENSQFSDESRKLVENLRQNISRSLWISNDK